MDEIAQLQAYLENGGKVLLTTSGYTETPDLDAVMAQFGLAREPGLVVEGMRATRCTATRTRCSRTTRPPTKAPRWTA